MSLLIATLAIGLVFAVLALGIYMSFRVYQMPDITADGSFPLGAAITARLLRDGADPVTATLAGMAGGALAGAAPDVVRTGAGSCSAVDAPGLRGRDRGLTEVASRPRVGSGHSGVDQ